jgi:serine/threonine-protein kinase
MGSVWVAEHMGLHTDVAVKFLSAELTSDETSVTRFAREAAAASQVKSPHVVQMFDHGVTDEGVPFIVMELLDGEDLTRRLQSGPMSLPVVSRVVTQVAKALTRAHEKGIVHRDIKSENIFLCDVGENEVFVKLLDFGIAKGGFEGRPMTGHTATGSLVGTPHYMSPEQAVGARDLDHRSDLWSLGMVTFEALTGRRAFAADTIGALVLEIHTAEMPRPSQFVRGLPPALDEWFLTACARKPEDRFGSAKEMSDALATIAAQASGRSPSARPNSAVMPSDALVRAASPMAATVAAPAHPKVPSLPPVGDVPSLRPPTDRQPPAGRAPDESWKEEIDRTNRFDTNAAERSGPPSPRRAPQAKAARFRGEDGGSSVPKAMLWVGAIVLLGLVVFVVQNGAGALSILFPGLAASTAPAPSAPPR